GSPQPRIRSSTSAGLSCGTLASAALIICTVRSSGRMLVMLPLKARPIGERAVATMTASGMSGSLAELVVYRTVAHSRDHVSRPPAGHQDQAGQRVLAPEVSSAMSDAALCLAAPARSLACSLVL